MKSELIAYTWRGLSGYSYGYILVTNNRTISDVRKQKRIALFGGLPKDWGARAALEDGGGIHVDYVCDFSLPFNCKKEYIVIRDYRELINDDSVFFIISPKSLYDVMQTVKYLQYHCVDNFGIMFEGYTKDFGGREKLQTAFFDAIYDVFKDIDFLNQWNEIENIRRVSLEGAGYWDVPLMWIYGIYKNLPNTKYLEVGPGNGVMSLTLKKIMKISVTWICIPDEESLWGEIKRETFREVIENNQIQIKEGYIELDSFEGEEEYDIIVLAQVMEHFIFNPVGTLRKLAKLLKMDGLFFISVPEEHKHYNVDSYKDMPSPSDLSSEEIERRTKINNFGHFREYSYDEAIELFDDAGLECVDYQYTPCIHHYMLRKRV